MAPLIIENGSRGGPQAPILYYNHHPLAGQQMSAPPVAFVGGSRPWGLFYQQPPPGGHNGMSNGYPMPLHFAPSGPLLTSPPMFAFGPNQPIMGPFHPGFAHQQPVPLVKIPRNINSRRNRVVPLVNDGCKKVSIIRRIREIFLRAGLRGGLTFMSSSPSPQGSEENNKMSMIPRPKLEGRSSPSSSSSGPASSTEPQNGIKKRRGLQRRPRIQQRPLPPPGVPRHRLSTTAPSENAAASVGPTYDKLVFDKNDDSSSSDDDEEENVAENMRNKVKASSSSGQGSKQTDDQGISDDWDCSQSMFWSFSSTDQLYNNIGGRYFGPPINKPKPKEDAESDDQAYSSIEDNSSGSHHYYCPIFLNNENAQREHDFYNLDDDFDADFDGFGDVNDMEEDGNDADVGFLGGGVEFCKCRTCAARIFRRYQDPLASNSCFFGRDGVSRRKPRGVLVDEVPHRWRQTRQISLDVQVAETQQVLPRIPSTKQQRPGGVKAVMSLDRALMTTTTGSENLRQDTVEFFTNPRRHVRRGTLDIVKPPLIPDARTSSIDEGVEADGCKGKHCACCPNSKKDAKDGDWPSWHCEDERAWMIWNGRRLSFNCPYPKLPMNDWELSNVKERTRRILMTTENPSSFGTSIMYASTKSWDYAQLPASTQDDSSDKKKCLIPRNWKRKGSNSTWDQGPINEDLVSIFDDNEGQTGTESKEASKDDNNNRATETSNALETAKKPQSEDDGEDDPIGAGIREADLKMSTVIRTGSNSYEEGSNRTTGSDVTKEPVSAQSSQNSDSGWESGGSYKRLVSKPSVGVSKQGNLSIDYSCSWKNLDEHWSMFV